MKTNRKAINFDLDTKKLKEIYSAKTGKPYNKAYDEIKKFMKENGFSHRQGSGYISKVSMSDIEMVAFIDKLQNKFSWIYACSKKVDGTEISAQFDLKTLMKTDVVGFQSKTDLSKDEYAAEADLQSEAKEINGSQEMITISKDEYNTFIKSFEAAAKHAKTISDVNLVLNEHPELKQEYLKAKAETMQKKAEREKGGLNDKSVKDKTSEHKPKKHKPKR